MLFKRHLANQIKGVPLLATGSIGPGPHDVLIAARIQASCVHIFRWDRLLSIIRNPSGLEDDIISLLIVKSPSTSKSSIVLGTKSGGGYQLDVDLPSSTSQHQQKHVSIIELNGSHHHCFTHPGLTHLVLVGHSMVAASGGSGGTKLYSLLDEDDDSMEKEPLADLSVLDEGGPLTAIISFLLPSDSSKEKEREKGALEGWVKTILGNMSREGDQVLFGASSVDGQVRWTPTTEQERGESCSAGQQWCQVDDDDRPVIGLLPISSLGLIAVGSKGWLRLLKGGEIVEKRVLKKSSKMRIQSVIHLQEDVIAYLSQGLIYLTRLSSLEEDSHVLDMTPDAVALAPADKSHLIVLTRRGRLVCLDWKKVLPPIAPILQQEQPPMAPIPSSTITPPNEEVETVQKIEKVCQATAKLRQELTTASEALDRLRAAWAVVAGRSMLSASLDIEPASRGSSASSRLSVRLTNPTSEAMPLQGWALVVRIQPAIEGPAVGFTQCLGADASSSIALGGSWGLRDLGPGERFQADVALPAGSMLPLTARLALCYPFSSSSLVGEGTHHAAAITWPPGLCLELGSRPLDLLDLSRPPKEVPLAPSALRPLEAQAHGKSMDWNRQLAYLLCRGFDDLRKQASRWKAAENAIELRPAQSTFLRILWPVLMEEGMEGESMKARLSVADLLGACDGVRSSEEGDGSSLAIEAPGGRILVARILLGPTTYEGQGGGAAGVGTSNCGSTSSLPATNIQLSLSGTDRGLLSLLRSACSQRLAPGACVRTRALPLTETRMRILEKAHNEMTSLSKGLDQLSRRIASAIGEEEVEEGHEGGSKEEEQGSSSHLVQLGKRLVDVAISLEKEVNESYLLDLRPN